MATSTPSWARANAGKMIVTGEGQPVGSHSQVVKDVAGWLRDKGVLVGPVTNEVWNLDDFPSRGSVLNLVNDKVRLG